MAAESYRVTGLNGLPQDSPVTCWAACAAMQQSGKKKQFLTETTVLGPYPYYDNLYSVKKALTENELKDLFVTKFGMTEGQMDLSSRRKLADFIKAHAPIIVGSAILNYPQGGGYVHVGYHVRIITGYWGYPDSTDEDALQIRIFDPAPPPGFQWETPFFFSHFKYQMTMKTGPAPGVVGHYWY